MTYLVPDQIPETPFPLTHMGRRGLEEGSVREFLEEVARQFSSLLSTLRELQSQNAALAQERADEEAAAQDYSAVASTSALQVLTQGQVMADHVVRDAQQQSAWVTAAARGRYEQIVSDAHQIAAQLREETDHEVAKAREAGRQAAPQIPADLEEKYASAYDDVLQQFMRRFATSLLEVVDGLDGKNHKAAVPS
jgi:cell division septum initiation protein DivIVA